MSLRRTRSQLQSQAPNIQARNGIFGQYWINVETGDPMDRFVNAGSWHVAVEIVRAFPACRIFHTHPGGGQYDCLTVIGDNVKIDINRAGGSIHSHESPAASRSPLIPGPEWQDDLRRGVPPRDLARRVASRCGLTWPTMTPPTRPHILGYRVIAQALTMTLFDSRQWDATTQFFDSSGMSFTDLVAAAPYPEMAAIPSNKVWIITSDAEPHSWLWDGWLWTPGGDRLDMYGAYRSGRSIDELAALAVQRSPKERAPVLPPIPGLPRQPIGEWP